MENELTSYYKELFLQGQDLKHISGEVYVPTVQAEFFLEMNKKT